VVQKPVVQKSAAPQPAAQKPAAQKPAAQKPAQPTPSAARPAAARPATTSSAKITRPTDARATGEIQREEAKRPEATERPTRTLLPSRSAPREISAKRQLRRAARERRRFEHAEVRRFTRRSRRRRTTVMTITGIVATLAIVLGVAVFSPILALREITIDGTARVSEDEVRAAVGEQLGTPLALVDLGHIREQLAEFPLIRSYVTETVPPNTLLIHIVEREPIAQVQRGETFGQVDPAGVTVASSAEKAALPLVQLDEGGVEGDAFASAVEVLLTMPDSVTTQVDTISATSADDVRLTLSEGGRSVMWGSAHESDLKAQVLEYMLAQESCKSQPIVDVSAPRAAVCGPERPTR